MTIDRLDGSGLPVRSERADGENNKPRTEAQETRVGGSDRIQLSAEAREIASLSEASKNLPDIRQEQVEAVRRELENGNYQIDSRKIAEQILELEDELGR